MAGGRPTKYKKEFCDQIIAAMEKGLSVQAASAECGFSHDSFYRWQEKHPEFSDAVKEGQRRCLVFWEKIGMKGMVGQIPGFNATTWIFNMKNRHNWVDKKEVSGKDGGPLNISITSDDAEIL